MTDTTTHMVLGTPVEMPVQIRTATAFMGMFSVPANRAQSLIADTGRRFHFLPLDISTTGKHGAVI